MSTETGVWEASLLNKVARRVSPKYLAISQRTYSKKSKYFLLDNARNKIVAPLKNHIAIVKEMKFVIKIRNQRSVGLVRSYYEVEILSLFLFLRRQQSC